MIIILLQLFILSKKNTMKKTLITFSLLLSTLANAQTDVRLDISHLHNNNPLQFNTPITNPSSENFEITRLEYYITDITLTHDGGVMTNISDAYVLVNAENHTNIPLGNFNITSLESIEFGIGVLEDKNHLDPSTYPSSHALAPKLNSMHWGWASGYRFIAFEGNSGADLNTLFQFHALGDINFQKQTIYTNGHQNSNEIIIALNADYYSALTDISLIDGPVKHGETLPECVKLIDNFKTSVFSENTSNPVSIIENPSTAISNLYPNPVSSEFTIELNSNNTETSSYTYTIVDILGHRIESKTLASKQSVSVDKLNNGLYFLEIYSNQDQLSRQSFIVNK